MLKLDQGFSWTNKKSTQILQRRRKFKGEEINVWFNLMKAFKNLKAERDEEGWQKETMSQPWPTWVLHFLRRFYWFTSLGFWRWCVPLFTDENPIFIKQITKNTWLGNSCHFCTKVRLRWKSVITIYGESCFPWYHYLPRERRREKTQIL